MAKRTKTKGMRKAYLKRFSQEYINTGPTHVQRGEPMWDHMPNGRQDAIRSIAEGIPLPKTKGLAVGVLHVRTAVPRALTIIKAETLRRHGTFEGYQHIVWQQRPSRTLKLFFGEQEWFWYEENHWEEIHRRSIIYNSKTRAVQVLETRKITWVEAINVPNKIPSAESPPC